MAWTDVLNLVILVLVLAPMIAVLGAVLIRWVRESARSRRRGHTPHCAKCDYNLTGSSGTVCPECGTALGPDTIVLGEASANWVGIVAAFFCLAFLLIAAGLLILKVEEAVRSIRGGV
jgi:hypothetical protein